MHSRTHLVVSVTLNPCIDSVLFVNGLRPGDTNRVQRVERDAGGKGINLSRLVQRLGGNTIASGFIGQGTGAHVVSVLDGEKVPHDFVRIAGETRTNVFIEDGDGPPTCLNEPGPFIDSAELDALKEEVKILSADAAWLAIGGSIPPGVSENIFCVLGEIGHAAKAKVLLDADGTALEQGLKSGPDLVKPNLKEAERLLGRKISGVHEVVAAALQIHEQLLHDQQRKGYDPMVIISMGGDGAVMACSQGAFVGTSPKVKVVSTIGSGDSMLGSFLWAFEQRKPLPECLRWGLAAGAATAMTSGAQIASKPTVLQLLDEGKVERFPLLDGARASA